MKLYILATFVLLIITSCTKYEKYITVGETFVITNSYNLTDSFDSKIISNEDVMLYRIIDKKDLLTQVYPIGSKNITVNTSGNNYIISYIIDGPKTNTTEYMKNNKLNKIVTISSNYNFKNVSLEVELPDYDIMDIQVYHLNKSKREEVKNFKVQHNKLEIIVPHLSNETYEIDLVILNQYESLRNGDTWNIYFNTTGIGNLSISSVNANWTELKSDELVTIDEMTFLNWTCGVNSLKDLLYIQLKNSSIVKYSDIPNSSQFKADKFIIYDYNCSTETSVFSNYMNIGGYATLKFEFTDGITYIQDFAYDPDYNLTTGLYAYYKADNSTEFYDDYGCSHGTKYGDASYHASGKINGKYNMTHNTANYIALPVSGACPVPGLTNSTTSTTISGWWYQNSMTANDYEIWFEVGLPSAGRQTLIYWSNSDDKVRTHPDGHTGPTISAGVWYHAVFIHNASNDKAKFFINNVSYTERSYTNSDTQIEHFFLGKSPHETDYLFGGVDEVAIWKRALTDEEVAILYNYGTGLPLSNFTSSSTDLTPPVWSSLSNSSVTNQSIFVQGTVSESSNFTVYNSTDNSTWTVAHSNTTSATGVRSTTLTGFTNNTIYYWKLGACDAALNCANSTVIDFTTLQNSDTTCSCPTINTNWVVSMSDNCKISSACSIGYGNLTFTGTGTFTINASINVTTIGTLANNQVIYIANNSLLTINNR